jgi:uncharacterized membrane protein (UPF0127 family)
VSYGRGCVRFGDESVDVLVPLTDAEMCAGLEGFRGLGPREGMLFMSDRWPAPSQVDMWMARVSFPLAMIWVDDGRVSALEPVVLPGDPRTYAHRGVACVEMDASAAADLGIVVGVPVRIDAGRC